MKHPTTTKRTNDRDLVVTRTFDAPARLVFQAWTTPELMKRWWVPKSIGIAMTACEMDVRTGGSYRFTFVFTNDPSKPMSFFGKYVEVTPPSRLVWTNEESADGSVTTVTFEERDGQTLLTMVDRYPSKEALDAALESGSTGAFEETFGQLDELFVTLS
ncbi:MAG: SRPBCC family protein [Archangiaceae bacterium]|nr:SRPBCC family protein [Archangiaceae bacterium]